MHDTSGGVITCLVVFIIIIIMIQVTSTALLYAKATEAPETVSHSDAQNNTVLSRLLNCSRDRAGSRRVAGRLFQILGPQAANGREPNLAD